MLYRAISANIGPTDAMAQVREYCLSVNSPASPRNVFPRIVHSPRIGMSEKPNVIHTAGRVYKKSVMMHTPGRVQILTLTLILTLAMYHASFVYTYGRPCV